MPRQWKRKTERGLPATVLITASEEVAKGNSIRSVAKGFDICHVTLYRYCNKLKKLQQQGSNELPRVGYWSPNTIFTTEQEKELGKYLLEACDRYYGLAPKEVRKFAFELAELFGINHPNQWDENKMAGVVWFSNFMKRHPSLSLRNPEVTSSARATSFNPENVKCFFNQLSQVLELHKF